jgi:Tfp pilus assembly protein PilF
MSKVDRLEKLTQFLKMDPDDAFTRYALALEYISRKDAAKGITLLKETIARDPRYVPAYHMLGQQLALQGDTEAATDVYGRGILAAQSIGDTHAASEMQAELDEMD